MREEDSGRKRKCVCVQGLTLTRIHLMELTEIYYTRERERERKREREGIDKESEQ